MDLASSAINAAVMGAIGLALWLLIRGRLEALDRRFDGIEARIDRLEERLDRRIDRVEEQVAALRADITQIALAVGAEPRAEPG